MSLLKQSLLSISTLCDSDCTVLFTKSDCKIHCNGEFILQGVRDKSISLWKTPISTSEGEKVYLPISEGAHFANNLEQFSSKTDIISFLHAALFSPVKSTWLRGIRRNNFVTWPGINSKDVAKHLQSSVATAKGHLDRQRTNIPSTTNLPIKKDPDKDKAPSPEEKTDDVAKYCELSLKLRAL